MKISNGNGNANIEFVFQRVCRWTQREDRDYSLATIQHKSGQLSCNCCQCCQSHPDSEFPDERKLLNNFKTNLHSLELKKSTKKKFF